IFTQCSEVPDENSSIIFAVIFQANNFLPVTGRAGQCNFTEKFQKDFKIATALDIIVDYQNFVITPHTAMTLLFYLHKAPETGCTASAPDRIKMIVESTE